MGELRSAVDQLAEQSGFTGVVRVDRDGGIQLEAAYGLAHRPLQVPNTVSTVFGTASCAKGFTALAVVSLIEDGTLELSTTARSILGADLPLIDDRVTLEHLLGHRSGIGDYLDESSGNDINHYAMPVPVHQLAEAEDFLAVLDGFPQAFEPGAQFTYCNGGFVVLALVAERASGVPYHDLVQQRVCDPAGLSRTGFFRLDELPGDAARGYLSIPGVVRTNVHHLPVRDVGDGGLYTTVAEMSAFWHALFENRIVSREWVDTMVEPRSDVPEESMRYGLGFWLHPNSDAVILLGYDAGVSFRSVHDPSTRTTATVIANHSEATWPIARLLDAQVFGDFE